MKRLWVVMCKINYRGLYVWVPCDFTEFVYSSTSRKRAVFLKKQIQLRLKQLNKAWYKNRFKVVEFVETEGK